MGAELTKLNLRHRVERRHLVLKACAREHEPAGGSVVLDM